MNRPRTMSAPDATMARRTSTAKRPGRDRTSLLLSLVAAVSSPITIELRRAAQCTNITPRIKGLDSVFFTVVHRLFPDGRGGQQIEPIPEPLIWENEPAGRPVLQCLAGLEPLLRELLERRGYLVRFTGGRPKPLPAPEPNESAAVGPPDERMLDFVRHHDRGLIRVDSVGSESVSRLVAQIALAWPKKRIIVVGTRIPDVRNVAKKLKRLGVKVGLSTSRHGSPSRRRVIVATPSRLGDGAVAIERCSIYIALNPSELFNGGDIHAWGTEGLKHLNRARVFGLLDERVTLPPRLRDLITALFGVEQIRFRACGQAPVDVEVVFARICGGARVAHHRDDGALKQLGVHQHQLRNRRICRLARALAEDDHRALRADPAVRAHLGKREVGRVGVLVDNVDHGLALARHLDWPLVADEGVVTDDLPPADCKLLTRGTKIGKNSHRAVVVTWRGLARAGRFDCLVRADGGMGGFDVPPTAVRRRQKLLLVDFRDEHHPVLRRWSRQRRNAYAIAGFAVIGEHVRSPLDEFLESRPEVYR